MAARSQVISILNGGCELSSVIQALLASVARVILGNPLGSVIRPHRLGVRLQDDHRLGVEVFLAGVDRHGDILIEPAEVAHDVLGRLISVLDSARKTIEDALDDAGDEGRLIVRLRYPG